VEHQRQYVGIDLHRRRSVIVRINDDGEVLETVRVVNDPLQLALAMANAGQDPEVALEATMAGIGRPICCKPRAPTCTSSIRSVCTGTQGV